jgi:Kdo2-lipid IVA lauroyltransferase/acyltransferase
MYYLVYGLLYIFSLLPFRVLYFISDGIYLILYYLIGYRKKVVMDNLNIAFPEKPESEKIIIAKKFYKNFVDTFIEIIKAISLSDKEFDKRCTGNFDLINEVAKSGRNIQLLGGHQFNWEYANLITSKKINIPAIGIYASIENKTFDKIFIKLRSRYNTILVSSKSFKRKMSDLMKMQHVMCLAADQNPSNLYNAYWLNFFGKRTAFVGGPEKSAVKNNPAIFLIYFIKLKRGHYSLEIGRLIENPNQYTPEQLLIIYRDFLEGVIRQQPEIYLWSHRRWKYSYNDDYKNKLIAED